MHPVIQKTFGGLSKQYYFRQFLFGLIFLAFMVFIASQSKAHTAPSAFALFVINSLLYPYSRFVYESLIGFVMGKNVFIVNAILMLIVKLFTMLVCWAFAIFIAPLGLLYLYFPHSKQQQQV